MSPMPGDLHIGKVTTSHLRRKAFVYVRQSTPRQVLENSESTKRQYGLRERALALGWPSEQIVVLDNDLGQSGASAVDRAGFQRLVTEVGMGQVGIVIGLEVSRLARSCVDWYRLLEICALTGTLILDDDGLYDPNHFNDRLLLGLKGTMSEAELHILKSRMRGGIESKARRGELKQNLPVGFSHTPEGRVVLSPDQQVQDAIRLLFKTFHRTGTAFATARAFRDQGLEFPVPGRTGPRLGEVLWTPLTHKRVMQILLNPRYAGAFFFGRTSRRPMDGQKKVRILPREEWHTLIQDAHPGYITWQQYEQNVARLQENARAHAEERRPGPPREGSALLQGIAICGICGKGMSVHYRSRKGGLAPDYVCMAQYDGRKRGTASGCQSIAGRSVDAAISSLLLEVVTPVALEVALTVQQELIARSEEVDRLRRQKVERARYEVELAQRRYMRVDPDNRLVAGTLEAEWNQALRALAEAQQQYEREQKSHQGLTEAQRDEILALATNFPRVWEDPRTPHRERKRMVRLMLEDVTLIAGRAITVQVRFKGGATRVLEVPRSLRFCDLFKTDRSTVALIDSLLDDYTPSQTATILNERGVTTGTGLPFHSLAVRTVQSAYRLTSRFNRLRARGLLTVDELALEIGVHPQTVRLWKQQGLLETQWYADNKYMIVRSDDMPRKVAHKKAATEAR